VVLSWLWCVGVYLEERVMVDQIHATLSKLVVPIEGLVPYGKNPRRGDVDAIAESLTVNGQYKPIVVRAGSNEVLAGNHTLKAARQLGWDKIAVTFVDVDDDGAARIVLVDNRSNDLATYDEAALAELLSSLPDLTGSGYGAVDLDELLEGGSGSAEPNEAPEPPVEPMSVLGDVWVLGRHRVMCGNSTEPGTLAKACGELVPSFINTDPPYGISIVRSDGHIGSGKIVPTRLYAPVAGDGDTDAARDAFVLLSAEYPKALQVWWGGNHYSASAGLPDSSCWIVWDKANGTNNFADCELAWTNSTRAVRRFTHMWNGMLRDSERGPRSHPTQKPVALAVWTFETLDPDCTHPVVLDVFAGAGFTLLAAEIAGRTAVCVELSPAYVDVICRRYQEHTGDKPVLESTGEPHDFTTKD